MLKYCDNIILTGLCMRYKPNEQNASTLIAEISLMDHCLAIKAKIENAAMNSVALLYHRPYPTPFWNENN